jgi:hypothetical protein
MSTNHLHVSVSEHSKANVLVADWGRSARPSPLQPRVIVETSRNYFDRAVVPQLISKGLWPHVAQLDWIAVN